MQRILASVLLVVSFLALAGEAIHPENYAEVLLRREAATPSSYLTSNRSFVYFVNVAGQNISAQQIRSLSNTGISFRPGNEWVQGSGMRVIVTAPRARKDGNYDVSASYYCSPRCGATVISVMRHTRRGWQVLSSSIQSPAVRDTPNNSFKPTPLRGSA